MRFRYSLRLMQLLPLISISTPSLSSSSSSLSHSSHCPRNANVMRNMSTTIQPTQEARVKMMELLDNNHCEFDINYYQFFANHMPHALCSLYSLGASASRLEEYYKWYAERLVPLREPKFIVTDDDWTSYLGNLYAYAEMLDFFDKKVTAYGIQKSLDTYLPRLIPGMIGEALHPLIHIGYAVEYELPRVLAEGLAYACTGYHEGGEIIDNLPQPEPAPSSDSSNHAVTVLELLNQLRSLEITEQFRKTGVSEDLQTILTKYGTQIKGLLASWDVHPYESKLNELTHATILAFFGSYRHKSLGFFMAHTFTGNHAVRVLLPYLKEDTQKARLLKLNLLALLGVYTVEGRPEFSEEVIQKYVEEKVKVKNIDWVEIIAQTIDCEDEHEIKVVRSLLVIKESVPDEVISHKLLDQCAYLMANTIQHEKEWIFDGPGYLSQDKYDNKE